MLTHVVMFKLKDRSESSMHEARNQLETLAGNIPELQSIEVGTDMIRSERSFDLVLIARFADKAALQAYQVHPVHVPVLAYMREASESIVAVDFEN